MGQGSSGTHSSAVEAGIQGSKSLLLAEDIMEGFKGEGTALLSLLRKAPNQWSENRPSQRHLDGKPALPSFLIFSGGCWNHHSPPDSQINWNQMVSLKNVAHCQDWRAECVSHIPFQNKNKR